MSDTFPVQAHCILAFPKHLPEEHAFGGPHTCKAITSVTNSTGAPFLGQSNSTHPFLDNGLQEQDALDRPVAHRDVRGGARKKIHGAGRCEKARK